MAHEKFLTPPLGTLLRTILAGNRLVPLDRHLLLDRLADCCEGQYKHGRQWSLHRQPNVRTFLAVTKVRMPLFAGIFKTGIRNL